MWARGAAIRPVPAYAVVPEIVLGTIERYFTDEVEDEELERAFARFESAQPKLADKVHALLDRPLDDVAVAVGYSLSLAVFLAFDRTFGLRLGEVTEQAVTATEASITLEEELRASHAHDPLELDDVVQAEQPALVQFLDEIVESALEVAHGEETDVDVDDVHGFYRLALVMTLALSYAVEPEGGVVPPAASTPELLA